MDNVLNLFKRCANIRMGANEVELEPLLNKNKNKKAYGIVTWYNFTYRGKMESLIYVSEDKNQTKKVLHYLNEKVDDTELIDYMVEHSKDGARKDGARKDVQRTNRRNPSFVGVEMNKHGLDKYYKKLHDVLDEHINLTYGVICIEGMINQSEDKIVTSRKNDTYYKLESLEKIRNYFKDEYII